MEGVTARLSLRLDWRTALGLLAAATALQIVMSLAGTGAGGWTSVVGIHVGLLALAPWRWWPGLLVGIVATTGVALVVDPPAALLVHAAAAGVLAAAGAAVVRRGTAKLLRTPGDLARLVAAAAVVGILCAALELATGLARVGVAPEGRVLAASLSMHALSVLVLVPVVLLVGRVPRRGPWWGVALHLGALAVATYLVFATESTVTAVIVPVALLGLAAYVFDLAVVSVELAAYLGVVMVLSARGLGPFGRLLPEADSPFEVAALTQGYALGAALVVLPLGIALHQQRRLQTRIAADEQLLRLNFEHAPVGMLLLEPDRDQPGRLVVEDLNDAACAVLGESRDGVLGRGLGELVTTDEQLPVPEDGLVGSGPVWRGRATVNGPSGNRVDLVLTSIGSRTDGPSYSAQLLDVTRELVADRQVADARQLAETTIDTAGCIILVTDAQGVVRRVNAAVQDITGYRPDELVGSLVWDTPVSPSNRAELEALLMWPNRSGLPEVREGTILAKDGRRLRLVWNSNVVGSQAGEPAYCVVTGVDVTLERAGTRMINHLMQASIGTAIVATDLQGLITSFNSGAEHLLACPVADALGRPFADFLDAEELERRGAMPVGQHRADPGSAFLVLAERLADGVETPAIDWTWITSDGERRVVSMTLSAMGDDAGRHGYLCVGRDVTRRREGHRALSEALAKEREAVERLQALDRARDELVSTISHELRTPISSILGYTELLTDGDLVAPDPRQVPLLESITRGSHRLLGICNDLLLIGGFEAGAMARLTMTRLDLRDSVRGALEGLQPLLVDRDLRVEVDWSGAEVPVIGDRVQVERAASNLISNAVKFTEDGGAVIIGVGVVADEAMLQVRDTGMGIAEEDQRAIFERFYRTDEAQHRAIPGTGLGLAIVDDIVRAHDGRVEVASAPGVGTTFTLWFPLAGEPGATAEVRALGAGTDGTEQREVSS